VARDHVQGVLSPEQAFALALWPESLLVSTDAALATFEDDLHELAEYIDATLGESGVDVDAQAACRGVGRWEITDEWRRW
jgi:hypothetical protein